VEAARAGIVALAGLLAALAGCGAPAAPSLPTAVRPAPSSAPAAADWSQLVDLDGRPAVASGAKAVAVVFVLPDCPICNAYVPELNRLHAEFTRRGAALVLVHADPATTTDAARQHAQEYQIAAPVAVDGQHVWVKRAQATTTPEAALFSPAGDLLYRGRIDDQYTGLGQRRTVVTSHDLRDALEAVLAGRPVSQSRTKAVGCPIPESPKGG